MLKKLFFFFLIKILKTLSLSLSLSLSLVVVVVVIVVVEAIMNYNVWIWWLGLVSGGRFRCLKVNFYGFVLIFALIWTIGVMDDVFDIICVVGARFVLIFCLIYAVVARFVLNFFFFNGCLDGWFGLKVIFVTLTSFLLPL